MDSAASRNYQKGQKRLGMKRFGPVLSLLIVIIICVGVFIFRRPQMSALRRINVLVGSSPVSVW